MASGSVGKGNRMVNIEKVIDTLETYGILKGADPLPTRKPTHGSCCTCQDCGHGYDDCICEHNNLLADLLKL